MEALGLKELEARADQLDLLALAAPEIDRYCSSASWILPAAEALMPPGEPWIAASPAGFALLMLRRRERLRVLEPFEASWGLASPLVGPDAGALVTLAADLILPRAREWDLALLAGVPQGGVLFRALVARLGSQRLGLGPTTRRHVASLAGGVDGFLSRRSRATRKSLRQAERRARAAGVTFEPVPAGSQLEADRLFERALAVDGRSWKGEQGIGMGTPEMEGFYRGMVRRLVARGALRCHFARLGDQDVAFVLGAVFGDTYRGLQFAFDDRHRSIGLGNLAQVVQLAALADDQTVTRYDLGTGGEYKLAWAEDVVDTVMLVVASR